MKAKYPLQDFVCKTCGGLYQRRVQKDNRTSYYCSKKCRDGRHRSVARIVCGVCGKEREETQCRIKQGLGRYCSQKCSQIAQKGTKKPHSKEWEENRIKAVREWSKNHEYKRGYNRPKEHTQPMLDALKKKMSENPEKYRQIAIRNLSKNKTLDLSGANSPWWKGGITKEWQQWKNAHNKEFDVWRKLIHERDGHRCRLCNSTERPEAHHIISVAECREIAFLPMNGILLCYECHKKTDSYGYKALQKKRPPTKNSMCLMFSIPNHFHVYPTVGNYQWTNNGVLVIFVSEMSDWRYEYLVFIHEFTEANLCKHRGIKEEDITKFDIEFERYREERIQNQKDIQGKHASAWYRRNKSTQAVIDEINSEEPGNDSNAPYRKEHVFATKIEMLLAHELGVQWDKYSKEVEGL